MSRLLFSWPFGVDEAAIYPTALKPSQISAHWSAGAGTGSQPVCAPPPTSPYPTAVVKDSPLVYYRFGELVAHPQDRVAFDSSSHRANAAYTNGVGPDVGALEGDDDAAVFGEGVVATQRTCCLRVRLRGRWRRGSTTSLRRSRCSSTAMSLTNMASKWVSTNYEAARSMLPRVKSPSRCRATGRKTTADGI